MANVGVSGSKIKVTRRRSQIWRPGGGMHHFGRVGFVTVVSMLLQQTKISFVKQLLSLFVPGQI